MADRIAQLRRELEQLENDERTARERDNNPIALLCAVLEKQSETMMQMMDRMLVTVEDNSRRSLAFYARDAEMASTLRRLSPDRAATRRAPPSKEPPKAREGEAAGFESAEVIARGPVQLPLGEELLGSADPVVRDPITGQVLGAVRGGYNPHSPFEV